MLHCPNKAAHKHNDQRPSFSVTEGTTVPIVVKCQSSSTCTQEILLQILKADGLWDFGDTSGAARSGGTLVSAPTRSQTKQAYLEPGEAIVKTYDYLEPDGLPVAQKARIEKPVPGEKAAKRFLWRKAGVKDWPAGDSGCLMHEMPLYRAPDVVAASFFDPVIFTEGEKAADACHDKGLVAVCFAGGATSRNFGDCFSLLAGRDVLIWPDNDIEGRKYAARVQMHLRPIAKTAIILPPFTRNEKDDAVEYFAGGGSADAIVALAPAQEPAVQWIDDDQITVDMPKGDRRIRFAFTEITHTSRGPDSLLKTTLVGPGYGNAGPSMRIISESGSSVEAYVRRLEAFYPDEEKKFWLRTLSEATSLLHEAIGNHDPSVLVSEQEDDRPMTFMVTDLLPTNAPTMLFGDGSSGKSWLALRMAMGVALTGDFAGLVCDEANVLYLDWETDYPTFKRRLLRVGEGMGLDRQETESAPIHYWRSPGTPFPDMVPAIREKIRKDNIGLVIIDSVSAAAGGPPEDSEVAQQFINGIARLGVTVLAIAHINRSEDTRKPYGSVFWHNFFRRTWFVLRQQEEESAEVAVGLYCRKANEGRLPRPLAFDLLFRDPSGPVTFGRANVADHRNLARGLSPWEQVRTELLRVGRAGVADLAGVTGLPETAIKQVLKDHRDQIVNVAPGEGRGRGNAGSYALRVAVQLLN